MNRILIKKIVKKIITPITKLQLFFSKYITNLSYDDAFANLKFIRKYRECNIECLNKINIKYDLMIVIPAYNVKEYINDCICSILEQQTEYSFQIVVVDDGSTDGTKKIIDTFKEYENIRIIHQENKGIAFARNKGLEEITGEYIMFVDSDDILFPNAIQSLLKKAYFNDADIVEGGNNVFSDEGKILRVKRYDETMENGYSKHRGQPWGKVIRSDIFKNIQFPNEFEYEDSIFEYYIIPLAKRKYNISDVIYGYRINNNSITRTSIRTSTCIDTYYLSIYLWNLYAQKFGITREFNIQILDQIALNYKRTKFFGRKILESGLIFQKETYVKIFNERKELNGKYSKLDEAIRNQDYGKYKLLCSRWQFI